MRVRWICLLGSVVACSDAPTAPAPPLDAGTPVTTDSSTRTWAISKLYLGDTSRTAARSDTAWKSFGWNLDGKVTAGDSTDVCTRTAGAPSNYQIDGIAGNDDAFGSLLLPLFESMLSNPEPSKSATAALQSGARTIQLRVFGAAADGQQTATGLTVAWLPSRDYAGDGPSTPFPGFTTMTDWPVRAEGLVDGATLSSPRVQFDAAVSYGVVFAGLPTPKASSDPTLTLEVVLGSIELPLVVHHARIAFTPKGEHVTDGMFAGVLDADELVAGFESIATTISPQLCGDDLAGVERQLRQAADILKDGTNVKGKPCDGISIGIGFDAELVANPTKVAKNPIVAPEPCP